VLVAFLGTAAIVIVFIVVGRWIDKRVSLIPKSEELVEAGRKKPLGSDHEAGTAPATAILLEAARIPKVVARQRCACKARAMEQLGDDDVRYGDKILRAVRLRCTECDARRNLYFELRAAT
jgi:hypothetical protein